MLTGSFIIISDGKLKYCKSIDKKYKPYIQGIDNEVLAGLQSMSPEDLAEVEEEFEGKAIFIYLGQSIYDDNGDLVGFSNDLEDLIEIDEEDLDDMYTDISEIRQPKNLIIDWRTDLDD